MNRYDFVLWVVMIIEKGSIVNLYCLSCQLVRLPSGMNNPRKGEICIGVVHCRMAVREEVEGIAF